MSLPCFCCWVTRNVWTILHHFLWTSWQLSFLLHVLFFFILFLLKIMYAVTSLWQLKATGIQQVSHRVLTLHLHFASSVYTIWPRVEFLIIQVPLVIGGSKTLRVCSQWCHSQILLQYLKGQVVFLYHYHYKCKYPAMEPSIPGWNLTYEILSIQVFCLFGSLLGE